MPFLRRLLLVGLAFIPANGWSERARSPADATVFIRVSGMVRAEVDDVWQRSVEEREVVLGTGSGFVFSPYGHVLTNQHVIGDKDVTLNVRGKDVRVQLTVETIEVVFPSASAGGEGDGADSVFVASVDAADPDLDLAVLSVSGAELPYLAFGDSEAVEPGQPVQVYGFPFGRQVEVGRASMPDIVPKVSVSRGAMSAKRAGDDGETRYLQTSATVNPGNSGGPMVDEDGFVVGIIRMKLVEGDGIGFAIPINLVKDFLEVRGLDQLLSATRLRLGPYQSLPDKGLRLRLPESQEDTSPTRLRVDTGRGLQDVPLTIDRVHSPWSLDELERALLSGGVFERFVSQESSRHPSSNRDGRALMGTARGAPRPEEPVARMEYALVDLGEERLVARFVGPEEQLAFNTSVLRGALGSLEAAGLLTAEIDRPVDVEWADGSFVSPGAPQLVLPAQWVREEGAPFPCPGLPTPDAVLLTSPVGDFTVSFLAAWWKSGPDVGKAAEACAPRPGSMGESSYASATDYLGVRYQVEGVFLEREDGVLQLELVVPLHKHEYVQSVFQDWVERNR